MELSRRTLFGAATAGSVLAATGLPAAQAATTSKVGSVAAGHLTATLHTPGQEKAMLPGGWLAGKVGLAVVTPFTAHSSGPDDYTLADLKQANPGCTFLAYVDGAVARPTAGDLGVFETTVDINQATENGWVAKDDSGAVVYYSDYDYMAVADLTNTGYRDEFAKLCTNIVTTPATSTHGAPDATFDGLFFDDTNMTPQHGLDDRNGFGPYSSNAAYGDAMVDFAADIATRIRTHNKDLRVMCNIGADPWNPEATGRALTLAAKRFGDAQLFDGFLREFTTYWYPSAEKNQIPINEFLPTIAFADKLKDQGVRLYTNDYAPPAADAAAGPTDAEQQDWDRRQRLTGGVGLLMGPAVTAGAVVTVPYGRDSQSNDGKAQTAWSPVGSLTDTIMQRLATSDAGNAVDGEVVTNGNVISRKLTSGTVYVNLGTDAATVNGVSVPGRDALIK